MKLFAITVGKDETHRYLEPMLKHSLSFVDDHFYFDDESTDGSPELATKLGAYAVRRASHIPSFEENEGAFRGAAWSAFELAFKPDEGDLVLVIDCDETLVSDIGTSPSELRSRLEGLDHQHSAYMINFSEVWGFHDVLGTPIIRVDRLWDTIHAPRLFRYRHGAAYYPGDYGVPSVPMYVQQGPWGDSNGLHMLHYGYARQEDQIAKYNRYRGRLGHSSEHVNSIVAPDQIRIPWGGHYVDEMRTTWRP